MPDKRYPPVSEDEMNVTSEEVASNFIQKEREPSSISEMLRERYKGHHTICQALRDIYQIADQSRLKSNSGDEYIIYIDEIKMKCRLAMAMAKAMHKKLKYYKEKELTLLKND